MRIQYLLYFLFPMAIFAQEQLTGVVLEGTDSDNTSTLFGANVYWLDTQIGTVTNEDGQFSIPYNSEYKKLVISYVGFTTDTLTISSLKPIRHILRPKGDLNEVTVKTRKKASSRSFIEAANVINVSSAELLKAACCNLSESFETNPSIDVNFADAISGTRQIKMLGLKSPNILITTENIPSIRGASQAYGLSFIPGTWVESIQITKGAGSVVNGFESIAGQINAELVKPSTDYPLFVNAYAGIDGRYELNTHLNTKVGKRWHTGLYVHGNLRSEKFDKNDDTFLDVPLAEQINIMNRWQYTDTENGFVSFINLRVMNDHKQTGQVQFDPDVHKLGNTFWGSEIETERYEASAKLGFVNPDIPYRSIGVQTAFSYHNQESYFGEKIYNINHQSFYGNAIYNTIISDSRHKIKTGISATYDSYEEDVRRSSYARKENSVGGFFEYAYDNLGDLNVTAGLRIDNHNLLGFFVTPRLHARYTPWLKTVFRFSAGSGRRSANIFTENQQLFSSNRVIKILDNDGPIYGLNPEKAWNYGLSFLQGFDLFGKSADISIDFYRTVFENQVVVDWGNPREILFYNLDGESFANSLQLEMNIELLTRLDLKMAYKYYDVQTTFNRNVDNRGTIEKAMIPKNRIFANAGWQSERNNKGAHWKADITYNWLDSQRYAFTDRSPEEFQLPDRTPTLSTLNFQLTRVFSPRFEIYLGGENITNVKQDNPIVSADDPFGFYFDTTFVYGPIFGASYYTGLRYKL